MFKVIIAGGRDFDNYELLKVHANHLLQNQTDIQVVSGAARGADKLGEKYADEKGYSISSHPANWDSYGKSAGYIRNKEMAEYADGLIAFWDGKSRGTKHMIDLAMKQGLKVKVVKY